MISRRVLLASAAAGALQIPASFGQALARQQVVHAGLGFDDITNLDPHFAVLSSDIPIVANIYEGMLLIPNGDVTTTQYRPGLAERWESSPDKRTWDFALRPGVRWHGDFGEVTAEDARFSLERVADPKVQSPFRGTLANLDRVETDGPNRLRVQLRQPDPYFPQLVVNLQAGYLVSKRAMEAGVNLKASPVGTGPFRFEALTAREKVVLVRNEDYWGPKPPIDQVVFQFVAQQGTRELAMRAGELEAIDLDSRQDVVDRMRRQKLVVDTTTSGTPYVLYINLTKKPFDDLRVRRALAHATDRGNLAAFIGPELFTPEHSSVPTGYVGHTDNVTRYEHDPIRARALLAEAGFPSGFSTDAIVSSSTLYLPIMQVLQEQWKKAGINVALKVVDHPTFHRMIRQDLSPLVIYNADRYPKTAQVYYDQFYAGPAAIGKPTAITNFSHYGEAMPGIDDLLDKARVATSAEEATRLWIGAQKKVAEDVPSIPLYEQKYAFGRVPALDLGYRLGNLPYYQYGSARLLAT